MFLSSSHEDPLPQTVSGFSYTQYTWSSSHSGLSSSGSGVLGPSEPEHCPSKDKKPSQCWQCFSYTHTLHLSTSHALHLLHAAFPQHVVSRNPVWRGGHSLHISCWTSLSFRRLNQKQGKINITQGKSAVSISNLPLSRSRCSWINPIQHVQLSSSHLCRARNTSVHLTAL